MRNNFYKVKDDLIIEVKPARAMIYTDKTGKPRILFRDMYKGYEYIIVSYGTHPCCYIGLPSNHEYYELDYDSIDLDVHGGLTYSGRLLHLPDIDRDKWYIGWDYAHMGDRFGNRDITDRFYKDHTWKTKELIKECIDAIDELIMECDE